MCIQYNDHLKKKKNFIHSSSFNIGQKISSSPPSLSQIGRDSWTTYTHLTYSPLSFSLSLLFICGHAIWNRISKTQREGEIVWTCHNISWNIITHDRDSGKRKRSQVIFLVHFLESPYVSIHIDFLSTRPKIGQLMNNKLSIWIGLFLNIERRIYLLWKEWRFIKLDPFTFIEQVDETIDLICLIDHLLKEHVSYRINSQMEKKISRPWCSSFAFFQSTKWFFSFDKIFQGLRVHRCSIQSSLRNSSILPTQFQGK